MYSVWTPVPSLHKGWSFYGEIYGENKLDFEFANDYGESFEDHFLHIENRH